MPIGEHLDQTGLPGRGIVIASWAGTGVFVLSGFLGWSLSGWADDVALAVALVLFGVGLIGFAAGFLIGVGRSRTETLSVAGLFLASSADRGTQRLLLGAIGTQTVAAFAFALLRPFTVAAFAILVPMFGLGCAAIWGARHGMFPARSATPREGL